MSRTIAFGLSLAAALTICFAGTVQASSYKVLHTFQGGGDGRSPSSGLIEDAAGNLYGVTGNGGGTVNCQGLGCGAVFKIAPDSEETVLYGFKGGTDGAFPRSDLTMDDAGNLYSTTQNGGTFNVGTVFKIAPDGTETVLHVFGASGDGSWPRGRLVRDEAGNLYGTTQMGGLGCGTVFKLAPDGTETILYAFSDSIDGCAPASLLADKAGNFYGVASGGILSSCPFGCGLVFKLAPDGTKSNLYVFQGGADGMYPSGLTHDKTDGFYGMTTAGGAGCENRGGCGTVFHIASDGTKTGIYAFKGGSDGDRPEDRLVKDKAGNLYGVTVEGGNGRYGHGTIFKISPDGTETVLHRFREDSGYNPFQRLTLDSNGNLLGVAYGGKGHCESNSKGRETACGVVFQFTP